jgi:O-antigen ligase
MSTISSAKSRLGIRNCCAVALIFIMPAQLLALESSVTTVRLYMLLVTVSTMIMVILPKRAEGQDLRYTISELTLLILFAYLALTTIWAQNKDLALIRLLGIMLLLLTYVNLSSLRIYFSSERLLQLTYFSVVLFLWMSLFLYALGLYFEFTDFTYFRKVGDKVDFHLGVYFEGGVFPRLRGITDSPANFGAYGLFFLTIFYYLGARFYVFFSSALIFLSTSLTCILILMLFFFAVARRKFIFLIATCLSFFFIVKAFEFVSGTHIDVLGPITGKLRGGSGRWELFGRGLEIFQENPFFGAGLNQAREFSLEAERVIQSTHNSILEVMVEGGLFGLVLLIIFIGAMHPKIVGLSKKSSLYSFYLLNVCILGLLSLANSTLYSDSTIYVLALIMAIVRRGDSDS